MHCVYNIICIYALYRLYLTKIFNVLYYRICFQSTVTFAFDLKSIFPKIFTSTISEDRICQICLNSFLFYHLSVARSTPRIEFVKYVSVHFILPFECSTSHSKNKTMKYSITVFFGPRMTDNSVNSDGRPAGLNTSIHTKKEKKFCNFWKISNGKSNL